ncbi:coiled-coil domain-containing protein 81 [Melopsittacus undulatus]|uniref:coiled-coil domain-containing protein 81 n=1 Tax=Melopsittacus undulatus TaxID=13146 RepID=UPI00146C94BA|nr:coiled-coil domain-containing protein 81 [Melopsittacus undulatus]
MAQIHNLMDNKDYAPSHKELEPLKYSQVASSIPSSRREVERCVQGTLSLLSYCLGQGEAVALVLKDLGVLLVQGSRVSVRFYSHFLEQLMGNWSLEGDGDKVSHLLDSGMSPSDPVSSLSTSGRVLIFPTFGIALETPRFPKDPLKSLGSAGGDKEMGMGMGTSPAPDEAMGVGSPGVPIPGVPIPGVPIPGVPIPMAGDGQEEATGMKKAQVR